MASDDMLGEDFAVRFRVGIEVLLAARLEQRAKVGRVALLSVLGEGVINLVTMKAGRKSGLLY